MNLRTAAAVSLAAVAALGALAPASAAGKPVVTKYTAQATPDPTTTGVGEVCEPVTPTARHRTEYKVPAAGTLKVELANTLDWAIGVRQGDKLLASADGTSPEAKETTTVKFKKAVTISVDACNFAGEPTVEVTLTFTPAA